MAVWGIPSFSSLPSDLRMDAEYFKPEYLELDRLLPSSNFRAWSDLGGTFITGPFGSAFTVDNYVEQSSYRYVRGKDVKPFFLLSDDNAYMPEDDFRRLEKYELQADDLLASVVGTLGNVAIVDDGIGRAVFSCKSTAYRSSSKYSFDPYYLCAYLNCKVGQAYLQRKPRGTIQTGLNLNDLKTIPIFFPSKSKRKEIGDLIKKSWNEFKRSKTLYPEAEAEMLDRMGWDKLIKQPSKSHYIQKFSGTQLGDRIDPEHFKPQFNNLRKHLQKVGALQIDQFSPKSNRGVQPEFVENGEVIVLDSKSVRPQGVTPTEEDRTSLEFYSSDKAEKGRVQFGDVLLNSTGLGTLGRASCYRLDEPAIVDNHVSIIRPDTNTCLPVYLSLFLNSPAGLAQTEMYQTGSSGQLELYPIHIKKILIYLPKNNKGKIDLKWQEKLAEKVIAASRAKVEAQAMLEKAKRMVEEAIEQEFAKSQMN